MGQNGQIANPTIYLLPMLQGRENINNGTKYKCSEENSVLLAKV